MAAVESSEHGPPLNAFLRNHWGIDKAKEWQLDATFDFEGSLVVRGDLQTEVLSATKPNATEKARVPSTPAKSQTSVILDSISKIVSNFHDSMKLD